MLSIKTKFYKSTGSRGFRRLLSYYSSGIIKNRKIKFNDKEVSNYPIFSDKKPFSARIRIVENENLDIPMNTFIESPANVYCNLNRFQRFLLKRQFKTTWLQQTENIKWLVMAIFAGVGAFLAVANFWLKCK